MRKSTSVVFFWETSLTLDRREQRRGRGSSSWNGVQKVSGLECLPDGQPLSIMLQERRMGQQANIQFRWVQGQFECCNTHNTPLTLKNSVTTAKKEKCHNSLVNISVSSPELVWCLLCLLSWCPRSNHCGIHSSVLPVCRSVSGPGRWAPLSESAGPGSDLRQVFAERLNLKWRLMPTLSLTCCVI